MFSRAYSSFPPSGIRSTLDRPDGGKKKNKGVGDGYRNTLCHPPTQKPRSVLSSKIESFFSFIFNSLDNFEDSFHHVAILIDITLNREEEGRKMHLRDQYLVGK